MNIETNNISGFQINEISRFIRKDSEYEKRLYSILQGSDIKNCSQKYITLSIKAGLVIGSYLSQVPYISPAIRVTNNVVVNTLFGFGEVLSWGTLLAYSTNEIVDHISNDRDISKITKEKNNRLSNAIYWPTLIILGQCAQIPGAYIAYQYNEESIFWAIVSPAFISLFTIHSLHAFCEKVARTNNLFSRLIYRNTEKPKLFQAKENFCSILESSISAFLSTPNDDGKRMILDIVSGKKAGLISRQFLHLFCKGLEAKMKEKEHLSVYLKAGDRIIKISGALLCFTRLYLDAYLVYLGSTLLVPNYYFSAMMIFLAIVPNIYLGVEITTQSSSDIFWGVVNLIQTLAERRDSSLTYTNMFTGLGYSIALFFSIFGTGGIFTVLEDYIGFEDEKGAFSGFVLVSVVLMLLTSMINLSNLAKEELMQRFFIKDEDKAVKALMSRIKKIINEINNMPIVDFFSFIEDLELSSEDVSVIEYLANSDKFSDLHEAIQKSLKENVG